MTASKPSTIPKPVPPRLPMRYRARAVRRDVRLAVIRRARRLISRLLRLSWRLQVTVCVEVDIFADDAHAARAHLEALLLHPDSRIVVYNAGRTINTHPWQSIGSVPILALHDTTTSFEDVDQRWTVTTSVTANILIAAADADDPYSYSEVDVDWPLAPGPYLIAPTITRDTAWEKTRTLTPVRRRHLR